MENKKESVLKRLRYWIKTEYKLYRKPRMQHLFLEIESDGKTENMVGCLRTRFSFRKTHANFPAKDQLIVVEQKIYRVFCVIHNYDHMQTKYLVKQIISDHFYS